MPLLGQHNFATFKGLRGRSVPDYSGCLGEMEYFPSEKCLLFLISHVIFKLFLVEL